MGRNFRITLLTILLSGCVLTIAYTREYHISMPEIKIDENLFKGSSIIDLSCANIIDDMHTISVKERNDTVEVVESKHKTTLFIDGDTLRLISNEDFITKSHDINNGLPVLWTKTDSIPSQIAFSHYVRTSVQYNGIAFGTLTNRRTPECTLVLSGNDTIFNAVKMYQKIDCHAKLYNLNVKADTIGESVSYKKRTESWYFFIPGIAIPILRHHQVYNISGNDTVTVEKHSYICDLSTLKDLTEQNTVRHDNHIYQPDMKVIADNKPKPSIIGKPTIRFSNDEMNLTFLISQDADVALIVYDITGIVYDVKECPGLQTGGNTITANVPEDCAIYAFTILLNGYNSYTEIICRK